MLSVRNPSKQKMLEKNWNDCGQPVFKQNPCQLNFVRWNGACLNTKMHAKMRKLSLLQLKRKCDKFRKLKWLRAKKWPNVRNKSKKHLNISTCFVRNRVRAMGLLMP